RFGAIRSVFRLGGVLNGAPTIDLLISFKMTDMCRTMN
ncbi:MAG: hypothetical protein ACI9WC_002467, partial [Arenicella sp.]